MIDKVKLAEKWKKEYEERRANNPVRKLAEANKRIEELENIIVGLESDLAEARSIDERY